MLFRAWYRNWASENHTAFNTVYLLPFGTFYRNMKLWKFAKLVVSKAVWETGFSLLTNHSSLIIIFFSLSLLSLLISLPNLSLVLQIKLPVCIIFLNKSLLRPIVCCGWLASLNLTSMHWPSCQKECYYLKWWTNTLHSKSCTFLRACLTVIQSVWRLGVYCKRLLKKMEGAR